MFYKSLICLIVVSLLPPILTLPSQYNEYEDNGIEVVTQPTDLNLNTTLSTALITISSIISGNDSSLNYDFYPTVHSALMAPFTLFTGLCKDFLKFYDQRSIFKAMSYSNLKSVIMSLPNKLVRYWSRLIEMEMECIYRTVCDLSAYLSPRLPQLLNQLLGVYFTTHSSENTYYRAVTNGMINHNCIHYYPKCSPMDFFDRLASNVTDMVTTTMNPMLVNVMNAIKSS